MHNILKSQKDKLLYIGCTKDLQKRANQHNSQKVPGTNERIPMDLIYYEAFSNKSDAFSREQWLKIGWGRNLKKMLSNTLKSLGGRA